MTKKSPPKKWSIKQLGQWLRHHDWVILLILVVSAIFWRTIHYPQRFNFSADQATSSQRAMEIWREKDLAIIGIPITSFTYQGQQAHIGATAYYFQLVFLLIGGFDPLWSSLAFTVFASLMVIPLYWGSKKLIGRRAGLVVTIIYALLPFYIDYTNFLWNPNTLLALIPLGVLAMGWAEEKKENWLYGLVGVIFGLLLTLHYQFIIGVIGVVIYYLFGKKISWPKIWWLMGGLAVGFLPVIAMEVLFNFQSTKIFWLMLTNPSGAQGGGIPLHYLLHNGLLLLILICGWVRKYWRAWLIGLIAALLIVVDAVIYLPRPEQNWSLPSGWHYENDVKIAEIIAESGLEKVNVVNLIYNSTAQVPKYILQAQRQAAVLTDNYAENDYLFIVDRQQTDFQTAINYEVNEFWPAVLIKEWDLDGEHKLYLWQRITPSEEPEGSGGEVE